MENRQDDDLGRRFAQGGEAELEEVITLYGAKLFRYCYHTLCDYHAAEDVTQTALMKAYRGRETFSGDSSLSTWLYRIAYTCCIDELRRRRPTLPLFAARDVPAYAEEADEFGQEVMEAMGRLTPLERTVVYARIAEEKSYREIAEISGESELALRKRYERAKRKLAGLLRYNPKTNQIERRAGNETI